MDRIEHKENESLSFSYRLNSFILLILLSLGCANESKSQNLIDQSKYIAHVPKKDLEFVDPSIVEDIRGSQKGRIFECIVKIHSLSGKYNSNDFIKDSGFENSVWLCEKEFDIWMNKKLYFDAARRNSNIDAEVLEFLGQEAESDPNLENILEKCSNGVTIDFESFTKLSNDYLTRLKKRNHIVKARQIEFAVNLLKV